MKTFNFSAAVYKDGKFYVAECPQVGTVSQGESVELALANLKEASELYLEEFPEYTNKSL
ncbi:MAG: type II toxin-antitoxin system HicB family antitoxin [Patescibacteria group bacterium]